MKNLILAFLSVLALTMAMSSCSDDAETTDRILLEETFENHVGHDKRTCSHAAHMEKLLSDPAFEQEYNKRIQKHLDYSAQKVGTRAICSSPTKVPVAVHFQGVNTAATLSCLTTLAQEAITAMNADFQGSNGDITNWTGNAASSFPGISFGEACLEFVLADKNHPSGYGLTNGDLAVTRNATNGDSDNNWSGYLNIFVGDAQGSLGYSPLGGSGNGDGVMIDKSYFGISTSCGNVGSSAPFNLGRTLTHELGHYLMLDHIWGNGCGQDDGVADTPNSASEYYECPTIGASSCGSTDLHMNYMDYSNDACMYMFTAGQATVTENYVASSLGNLTSNVANVISGSSTGGGSTGGGGTNTTCGTPTTSSSQVISSTSVKATWDAQPSASKYQIRYRIVGGSTWTTKTSLVAEKTLVSLSPATDYEYRIRTRCGASWTSFSALYNFTTPAGNGGGNGSGTTTCDKPGYSSSEYLTAKRTKVSWEAMPQAIRYQIRYRIAGTSSWSAKSSTTPNKTLTNLQNGATYEYRIRTRCSAGWTPQTAIETFVQSSGGSGGGNGNGSVNNTINFNLTLDNYGSETSWELVDDNYNIIQNGGPFANNSAGTVIQETFSIPDGCYTLYVDDAYGDGICCAYGDGSFELLDSTGSQIGYSDGVFGNYDLLSFCVTNNVATLNRQKTDEKMVDLEPKAAHSN